MIRYSIVIVCVVASISATWGQEERVAGALLPVTPTPAAQIANRFLFAERHFEGAAAVESRVREEIMQFADGDSLELTVECRVSICLALASSPDDLQISRLWDAKDPHERLPWEGSLLFDLAHNADFESITSIRVVHSDGSRQLILYFYGAE